MFIPMLRIIVVFLTHALLLGTADAAVYMGAGLGSDTIDFKQSAHIVRPMDFDVVDQSHLSGTGVFGTVFAGYACQHDKWYLAAEINANLSSSAFSASNVERLRGNSSSTQYKLKNSVGLSVLPGYFLAENTLLYLRLAYANARLQVQTSDSSLQNVSHRSGGIRYGLGLRQSINKRFSFRVDYSVANFKQTQMRTFDSLSSTTKLTTLSPREQLVELAMIYTFDSDTKTV